MVDNLTAQYPKVIAVTLNWNGKEYTLECLRSLLAMDYSNFQVAVVDNSSRDGSASAFRETFPNITVLENRANLGYALGFNTGIEYALGQGAKYVLILNNDTVIDKNALTEMVKVAESDPRIGFVSGKVYSHRDPNRLQGAGKTVSFWTGVTYNIGAGQIDRGQFDEIKEYLFLDDVFLLAGAEVFQKVGMYNSNFFLTWEETDLCVRVGRAGYKLVYTPWAKIWHKGSQSTGGGTNPVNTYYLTRNQIVFMRRNASPWQFLVFVLLLFVFQSPFRIAAHLKRKRSNCLFPYLKGVISGLGWAFRGS